ncbi:hypothetical protein FHY55_13385 [Oceanicola sp. D3]|uniref:hypothetical protein n=1 Tax=Oceanicola sp. D3 TaxID=2587163 RepID=UPI00111F3735|nr:hypothetical protein [Oceanicola sp. D3]QDC10179.1 hypothetical protein FHY55_13385 [Oceanicola sp. D3]
MTEWTIECAEEDCEVCEMKCSGSPVGRTCPETGADIVRATPIRSDGDRTFSLSNRAGLRWRTHVRGSLMKGQTIGGKLVCAICRKPIDIDDAGKISYKSKSGRLHREAPPIDHYGPDWRHRKRKVERDPVYRRGGVQKQYKMLMNAYNAMPLRITHRHCNLARSKGDA